MSSELYCIHCGIKYDLHNGHWEYVDTLEAIEIWYCCHSCRDKGEPCETFFPTDEDRNNNNLYVY